MSCNPLQIERANQEVKQREAEVEKKLTEAKQALDEAAQREAGARRATAELQRLDKQLSARKLDAKELQVINVPQVAYLHSSKSWIPSEDSCTGLSFPAVAVTWQCCAFPSSLSRRRDLSELS